MVLLAASGSAVVLAAPDVGAQELTKAELAQARAKFQQATELEHAGNWAGALSAFREVGTVRMTPQVRYHIAFCEEKLGKLVVALGGYEMALGEAENMAPDFVAEVQTAIEQLKARIPKITISRGDGAEAATIELDGVALGNSSVGVETPIDPGPHTVSATAPGREKFSETVNISEQEAKTLTIEMAELASDAPTTTTTGGIGEPVATDEGPKFGIAPYVLGGVGAVGLITSGVLFALNQSAVSDLESRCPNNTCDTSKDPSAQDDFNAAKTKETFAWVAGGVGVAALGTGVALFLLDRKPSQEGDVTAQSRRIQVTASAPGADVGGLSLRGAF